MPERRGGESSPRANYVRAWRHAAHHALTYNGTLTPDDQVYGQAADPHVSCHAGTTPPTMTCEDDTMRIIDLTTCSVVPQPPDRTTKVDPPHVSNLLECGPLACGLGLSRPAGYRGQRPMILALKGTALRLHYSSLSAARSTTDDTHILPQECGVQRHGHTRVHSTTSPDPPGPPVSSTRCP